MKGADFQKNTKGIFFASLTVIGCFGVSPCRGEVIGPELTETSEIKFYVPNVTGMTLQPVSDAVWGGSITQGTVLARGTVSGNNITQYGLRWISGAPESNNGNYRIIKDRETNSKPIMVLFIHDGSGATSAWTDAGGYRISPWNNGSNSQEFTIMTPAGGFPPQTGLLGHYDFTLEAISYVP